MAYMGVCAVSGQEAWASHAAGFGGIYHTTDGGNTWTQITHLGGEDLPGLWTISFATQPIPEPSTLLLCLGFLGTNAIWLGLRHRK